MSFLLFTRFPSIALSISSSDPPQGAIGLGLSSGLLFCATDLPTLIATTLVGGFANGLMSGIVLTLGADLAPAHVRGPFLGVFYLLADCGSTVGPLLAGGLPGVLGSLVLTGYCFLGIGLVTAAWVLLVCAETNPRQERR
jgi:MFS family permease